jgi:transcriptional regulator with XRE-family HTH domain
VPPSAKERSKLQNLGANVRRVRNARGMTQERLAELMDVHLRSVQKIEGAEITILVTTLHRLRDALKCSWEELLGR